jgi:hypothetical protein
MNIGVFSCDPGGATGVAWGIFNPHAKGGAGEALLTKQLSGSATVEGDLRNQIREIAELWQAFYRACVNSAQLPPENVWFVMEDFIYKPGTVYGGEDSMISTGLIWGIEGYRMGTRDEWKRHKRGQIKMPDMILQTASEAKGYMTNARLKEFGCWVVGRDHERSAWQHIGFFLKHYIQQYI